MAFGPGRTPSFTREPANIEDVRKRVGESSSAVAFVKFLEGLDPAKTAIFYEKKTEPHSGSHGFRMVHFIGKVEENWNDVWGMTWYGMGAWMS